MIAAGKYGGFLYCLFTLNLLTQSGYAQLSTTASHESPPPVSQSYLRINEVNAKAARHFANHFASDGTEKWAIIDGFYIASFSQGNVKTEVFYNSRGGFAYTVKSYPADLLLVDIKLAILRKFQDHIIDVITEISNLSEKLYYIRIKNSSNIKMLKIVGNEMEITEDFANGGT